MAQTQHVRPHPSDPHRGDIGYWHAPLATLLISPDGLIASANHATERMLGRTQSELGRMRFADLIDASEQAEFEIALATASVSADGGYNGHPWKMVCPDSGSRTVSIHLGATGDGSVVTQLVSHSAHGRGETTDSEQRAFRTALLELGELSHEIEDDSRFYATLLQRAIDVIAGAQAGSILLRRAGTLEYDFVAAVGFDLARLQERTLHEREMFRDVVNPSAKIHVRPAGEIRRLVATGTAEQERIDWMFTAGRLDEIVTNVSVPIQIDGDAVGFISLDNFEDPGAFNSTSIEMTTLLGRLIADLLRRRALEIELRLERESYKHLAHHDELTGIANRRQLETSLAETVERAQRFERPFAVLFADIDDFKQLNDTHGHDLGDLALVAVSDALVGATRAGDIVGRWGGDEFMVIAPGAPSVDVALNVADRILQRFGRELRLPTGETISCQLSIGAAWSADGSEGLHAVLQRADDALYQAKKQGKATVRVVDGGSDAVPALD